MLLLLLTIPLVCTVLSLLPMNNRMRIMLLLLVSLGHAAMTASFWRALPGAEFNGIIVLDNIGLILLSVISLLFTSVSLYMIGYFDHEKRNNRVFVLCLSLLMSVMSLVAVSYHIGLMWVAIATTTLFSAPLISFHRNKNSLEATWKYLLVCSVGIAMALMGTFFLAISAHGLDTLLLPGLLNGAGQLSGNWLKLSVIFLLVGYGCKMGLAPMHSWKPEAYGHSIGIATVIMAGGTTQCAFLALVRVSQICSKAGLSGFYSSILILTGIISLVVPAVFILGERNIKRIFSYSSVEHMGILILGLAFGGPGIFGSFFHMVNNALAKVAMFLTAGSIAQKYGSSRADDIKGVIHAYPVTGVFLLAGLFAGTGMFPFATFFSELMILYAAILSGHYVAAIFFVVCLAAIFVGIARVVFEMVYGEPTVPVLAKKENKFMNISIIAALVILAGIGMWLPAHLENIINGAVQVASLK